MKTIMLYANDDAGLESRLQGALDLARAFDAHLTCLQVTPFDSFLMGDPFGGVYALPAVLDQVRKSEDEHRARLEERLRIEGVGWDWLRYDGAPAQMVVDRSRLSDLIVLSLADGSHGGPPTMVPDVALHARGPVLGLPPASRAFDGFGTAMIAWNGALEAAHALQLSLPLLRRASAVKVVTVSEDRSEFPATDASLYLDRHGIVAELHEWTRGERSTAETLLDAAGALEATYVVMGAFGYSRLREALLGGVTRDMLRLSPLPLLLAH